MKNTNVTNSVEFSLEKAEKEAYGNDKPWFYEDNSVPNGFIEGARWQFNQDKSLLEQAQAKIKELEKELYHLKNAGS